MCRVDVSQVPGHSATAFPGTFPLPGESRRQTSQTARLSCQGSRKMLNVHMSLPGQKREEYPFDKPSEKGTRTASLAYLFADVRFGLLRRCATEVVLSSVTGAWLVFDRVHLRRLSTVLMRTEAQYNTIR